MNKLLFHSLCLTCISFLFLFSAARASEIHGQVVSIKVRDDGLHWIMVKGERTEKPSCARYDYMMIKDENAAYGKAQLSLLITALTSGKAVTVWGENTCTRWGDGEDINTVELLP